MFPNFEKFTLMKQTETTTSDSTGNNTLLAVSGHFVSQSCQGEKCFCGEQATHKLGEEIMHDDPNQIRHNLTAYVCCRHFQMVLGQAACASGAVDTVAARGMQIKVPTAQEYIDFMKKQYSDETDERKSSEGQP